MGKNLGFFHLGTPKTAFLMRNLHIDPCNLGIFPSKQGHSFQRPKKRRGSFPLLPVSLHLLTYFQIFISPPKKVPEVSRIYGSHFGWRVKQVSQERQIL